jgi:hypothetical protein
MREVEKSEGNYMSRERPIGNLGRQNRGNEQTNKRSDENVPCDFRGGKKQKKKCAMFIIHEVFMLLSTTLL